MFIKKALPFEQESITFHDSRMSWFSTFSESSRTYFLRKHHIKNPRNDWIKPKNIESTRIDDRTRLNPKNNWINSKNIE